MRDPFETIAEEWEAAERPETVPDTNGLSSKKPWLIDSQYGGMTESSARLSWEGRKRRGKIVPVAFPLQAFESIRLEADRRNYLVKGLIANTGLAVIWGPPKCGKSFWAADLGMHIALGWNYRGHKVQQAPVVYVALGPPRFSGSHRGLPPASRSGKCAVFPRHCLTRLVAEHSQLIAAIKAQLGTALPGALFLDTLNRSFVGSESKDEDMARFLAAAESVALELSCAVVIVHHCGIDASRPRGHTSLSGRSKANWQSSAPTPAKLLSR